MGYATQVQVLAEFKDFTPTASTPVSITDIDQWIAEADAEINSRLGVKYQVPLTGTEALVMCRMIEIWMVKFRIQQVNAVKSGDEKTNQEGETSLRKQALDLLDKIASGKVILSDATLAQSYDGVRSYSNDNDTSQVFDRDTRQW